MFRPSDVLSDDYACEVKFTDKASFSLKKELIEKIKEEAFITAKMPLMHIDIAGLKVAVLLWEDFLDIKELAMKERIGSL